jgi:DnaK suppressor protein
MAIKNQDDTPSPRKRKSQTASASLTGTGGDNSSPEVINAAGVDDIPPQQRKDLDVSHYRDRLFEEMAKFEEEREYLRRSASDMDGNLPEDAESEDDTADLASSLMDKEMDMSVEEEIDETMMAIEHALEKIQDGSYGICDVSGEPIPKSRLELLPWSSLTAQMQAMSEGE